MGCSHSEVRYQLSGHWTCLECGEDVTRLYAAREQRPHLDIQDIDDMQAEWDR
jgi:hypothetical protein